MHKIMLNYIKYNRFIVIVSRKWKVGWISFPPFFLSIVSKFGFGTVHHIYRKKEHSHPPLPTKKKKNKCSECGAAVKRPGKLCMLHPREASPSSERMLTDWSEGDFSHIISVTSRHSPALAWLHPYSGSPWPLHSDWERFFLTLSTGRIENVTAVASWDQDQMCPVQDTRQNVAALGETGLDPTPDCVYWLRFTKAQDQSGRLKIFFNGAPVFDGETIIFLLWCQTSG